MSNPGYGHTKGDPIPDQHARYKDPTPSGSPADADHLGDDARPKVHTPEEVHEYAIQHLHAKVASGGGYVSDGLEDDERVSSSVVENPEEELGGAFDDADDADGSSIDTAGQGDELLRLVESDAGRHSAEGERGAYAEEPLPTDGVPLRTEQALTVEARDAAPAGSPVEAPVSTVGLINEGCTCYLNSLLQLLFHLSYLRSAVYRIPADEAAGDADAITVYKALQELFFQMQERTTPGRTTKLTTAFGWREEELFVQHDIQEMATILRDNLEEKMKGTVTEGAIRQLFEGRGEQFVETLDKTYTSRSKDVFYDIHTPLADHTNLLDSLKSLTQRDQLVGDNKYKVEEEGKKPVYKDAEKGYQYIRFPPVTWFHLKRFAMDLTSPTLEMKKVNTRMEFPLVLDLRELEKGLSPEERAAADKGDSKLGSALEPFTMDSPAIYDLQGVIVHRGTVRSGHYYCYIRDWDPVSQSFTRWIEFDDESVRVVPAEVAVDANYGGSLGRGGTGGGPYHRDLPPLSNANAYILSYVRRADAPRILAPSPTDIITQRVKDALRREMEEEERRTKLEQAQKACVVVYVVTDESLAAYAEENPTDLFPRDARTAKHYAACVVEVLKSDSLVTAYELIAAEPSLAERGVTPTNIRLWRWTSARAYRPSLPLATVAECRRQPLLVSDCLAAGEQDRPLSMCVYVEERPSFLTTAAALPPPVPPAADVLPLVKRSMYNGQRGTHTIVLKTATWVQALDIRLDYHYAHSCKVQYILTAASGEELPLKVYRGALSNGVIHVPVEAEAPATEILLQCSSGADILPVIAVHVEVPATRMPPATATVAAKRAPEAALSRIGPDRFLLLLKWFDHVSGTVRYVGSALVDSSATLHSLSPLWYLLTGTPVPPALVPPQYAAVLREWDSFGFDAGVYTPLLPPPSSTSAAPTQSPFAFYEEAKGAVTRELHPQADLWSCGLQSGSVIVAQSVEFPLAYRHAHVETYYNTLESTIDVRLLEVATRTRDHEQEYRQCLAEHKKLALRWAEEAERAAQAAPPPPPTPPPSLQSPTTKPIPNNRPSLPKVEADPALDPFHTQLPTLIQPHLEVIGSSVGRMHTQWLGGTACDAIAMAIRADPNYLRLYKCTSAVEPAPEEHPVRDLPDTTVESLVTLDGCAVTPVIFYERLTVPRAQMELSLNLRVTLRDAAGAAVHCEAYTLPPRQTLQGLIRQVRTSIRDWELAADPFGSLRATLSSPHYVLLAISKRHKLIRFIYEVPMVPTTNGVALVESKLDPALVDYEVEVMPAAALRAGEQRIACCHGDYRQADVTIHGHPFTITINAQTSVREGLRRMQCVTHVPTEALNAQRETGKDYSVMMYTDVPLHFINWDEALSCFWEHTQNRSGYIPSLLLNHLRPKEKPGSRYVAQHNPKLKIAKN